jgi:arginine utilization protein RocB
MEMELNTSFCEMAPFQESLPPTAQLQKDLKNDYSVQIPHRSVSLYNLPLMERSVEKNGGDAAGNSKNSGRED